MVKIFNVNNLCFSYRNKKVFDSLSFYLERNTITAFLSPNSCGKTTLVKILSGIFKSKDCLYYNDIIINKKNFKKISLDFGVILYQNKYNFLFENVEDELMFSLENLSYSCYLINDKINYFLTLFKLKKIRNYKIVDLNEYQKVCVSIIISLLHEPKILFLDSIFDSLNFDDIEKIMNVLKKLDITIFFTTNNINSTIFCDKLIIYNGEKIVYNDVPSNVFSHDNEIIKMGIDIPLMMDLSLKLQFYDLIDCIINDPKRMVDTLWH